MGVREVEVEHDGRRLRVEDTGPSAGLTVVWHHGPPRAGPLPRSLSATAARLGVRWVSYDRPGYGGSTRNPGHDLGTVATDVAAVADALGVGRFAVMGHAHGGSHALACAALLPDRVRAVVAMAGWAPLDAEGLHWFAGMEAGPMATLRATVEGREARERHDAYVGADGHGGQVDDDLALVAYWGCEPAAVTAPTLIVHGRQDRVVPVAHAEWLAGAILGATAWLRDDDGHLSVLEAADEALEWLVRAAP